jgi:glycosyltransferase involved in cell wall biosynthesis
VHILYLIDSLAAGGAETSLASLASELVARDVRLDVAYLRERPGVADDLREAGATLSSLAGHRHRAGRVRELRQLIRNLGPDLVHTTLFEADVVGRLAAASLGVPVVTTLANVAYGSEQLTNPDLRRWKVRSAQAVDAVTARLASRFHAISDTVAEVMGRRLALDPARIDVVPRGRNPQRLGRRSQERRRAARQMLGVRSNTALVVAAARHEHQKGLDVLVQAWPEIRAGVPRAQLVIAGREGNQSPVLRQLLSDPAGDGDVRLLGARTDVPELLCAADVFVMPSRWEGLGSVLLEAMALEAPIVASDLPSVREVTGADCASLAPPGDRRGLATAVLEVLAEPAIAGRRARSAHSRFLEHFTIERVTDGMLDFYRRALEEGPCLPITRARYGRPS